MTADQVKGKGFKGALGYNLDKVENGIATVITSTFNKEDDLQAILKEVNLVRMQRPNLAKYFYHTSLNFPVNEDLPDEKMKVIASDYLKAMGFGGNQHIIFRHFDADHPHLHILVNRIGYDGAVVSDSKDYQRSEQALRKLEKRYGLTEVIGSKQAKERAMTKNELEMMKRTNEPSTKMKVQVIIKEALKGNPDITTFIARLEKSGVNVLFNQATTGFVSGISYGYENMQFKGAQLGNAFKWQAIKTATGYEQERDRTAIYEANVWTGSLRAERATAAGDNTRERAESGGIRQWGSYAQDDRDALQQSTTQLKKQLEQGSGQGTGQVDGNRDLGSQSRLPNETDRQQRRTGQEGTEQGRQQVAHPGVRDSSIIGHLLGTVDPDRSVAENEMNTGRRRRKKRRRGLSQ